MVSILATTANVLLNRILVSYSNAAVAGMGVAMKINTVAVYVQLGLGTGIQPLIGYNYGAVIVSYAVCIAYIRKMK